MTTISIARRSLTVAGVARISVAAIGLIVAASAAYVLAVPVDPDFFASTTGTSWQAFASANPEIAAYVEREARLLGATSVGLGLLAAAIAWRLPASGGRGMAMALWLLPLTLGGTAATFLTGSGAEGLAAYYGALAVLSAAAVAGLVARRAGA